MSEIVTQSIQPRNVFEVVEQQEKSFMAINSDVGTWTKESQFAIQQLQKNDYLNEIAWGNIASLQNAIINVASIGISLNPANKHAYLVPRDNMVCLDISYMGLLHLAMQSDSIEWGQAKLVYENDTYINKGIDKAPQHDSKTFGDKGSVVGAYCTVKLPSGDFLTEEMDIEALNKVKESSKAANGPWKTWPEEMMRKTVVKRASKYWPSCETVNTAIQVLNEHEGFNEPFTEEKKILVDNLLESKNAFSFHALVAQMDDEEMNGLFNSFKKGEISSNKALWRELSNQGREMWVEFAETIKMYIGNSDLESIQSELQGFDDYEKKHLCNLIGEVNATALMEAI